MKKSILFFAIIIAMLSFTACSSNVTPVQQEITLTAVQSVGSGITIPADSVYFKYQYPRLGKWLDCNLKNQGFKKLVGWITVGEWVRFPKRYISDSLIVATTNYRNVPKGAMIVDTTALISGSGGSASDAAASAPSFKPGFVKNPEDHSYSIFGLGCIPSILLTIFLILAIWYLLKKLFGGNGNSNPGTTGGVNNQQTIVNPPSGNGTGNVQWSINPDSTVTINTGNSSVSIAPDSTVTGSRR